MRGSCRASMDGRFFIMALSGVLTAAVAGTAAAEISENYGLTGSSEVVITTAAAGVALVLPAAVILLKGLFKNVSPVIIDPIAGLATAVGAAGGLGLYEAATALGAPHAWASLVGAVGGTLTTVGAGMGLHRCAKRSEVDRPLIGVTDVTDGASA